MWEVRCTGWVRGVMFGGREEGMGGGEHTLRPRAGAAAEAMETDESGKAEEAPPAEKMEE